MSVWWSFDKEQSLLVVLSDRSNVMMAQISPSFVLIGSSNTCLE